MAQRLIYDTRSIRCTVQCETKWEVIVLALDQKDDLFTASEEQNRAWKELCE